MIRLCLVGFCMLCTLFSSYAQTTSSTDSIKPFQISLQIGPNLFVTNGEHFMGDFSTRMDLSFGLSLEYYVHPRWSLVTGGFYDTKLRQSDRQHYYPNFTPYHDTRSPYWLYASSKFRFRYLNIPFLIRHHFGPKNNVFADLGMSYNRLLNLREFYQFDGAPVRSRSYPNGYFKKEDYNLAIGLGYKFKLKGQRFGLHLKYELGLNNILEAPPIPLNDLTLKTRTYKLLVFWEIPF